MPAPPPQMAAPPVLPAVQEFGAAQRLPEAGETRDWQLPPTPAQTPSRFDAPLPDFAPPAFNQPDSLPSPSFSPPQFSQLDPNPPAFSAAPELPRFGGSDLLVATTSLRWCCPLLPPTMSPGASFPGSPPGPPLGTLPPLGQPAQGGGLGGFAAPQAPQAMMSPPAPPPAQAKSRSSTIIALVVLVVLILVALAVVALLFLRK